MARKLIPPYVKETIIAKWKSGDYKVKHLADEYKLTERCIHKMLAGYEHDNAHIVQAGVDYKSGLYNLSPLDAEIVTKIVDEKTRMVGFFNEVTVLNIRSMIGKIDKKTSIYDHKLAQSAIKEGKETVFGRQPEVAVQVNTQDRRASVEHLTDEQLRFLSAIPIND